MFKLTRYGLQAREGNPCYKNWPMTIKVEATEEGVDPNIFVFHTRADDSVNGEDPFCDVADVHDLNTIPTEESIQLEHERPIQDTIPFYRKSEVSFDFLYLKQAEYAWESIKGRVARLEKELRTYKKLKPLEEIEI